MKKRGFTLIETVVAIFLLTVGTVGSFSLMQKVTSFASISSSQFVASYLAQEGIEIIRNIRDINYLQKIAWDSDIAAGTSYRLDYRSLKFPDTDNIICGDYLKHDGNFYICSTDSAGKFQREITIGKPVLNKMVVSVEVSWSERGNRHQVLAQTELYNWR
ncbi:MAG: prepilin-type N-terminal cleavage/methylation domain-containing protein [Candidatus Nealsonbacteria bacterium]